MSEPRDRYSPRHEHRPTRAREEFPERYDRDRDRYARERERHPDSEWDELERNDVDRGEHDDRGRRLADQRAFEQRPRRGMHERSDPYGAGPDWPSAPATWPRADVREGPGSDRAPDWPREPRPGYTEDWGLERGEERRRQEFREGRAPGTVFGSFAASDDYRDALLEGRDEPRARESYAGRGPKGYQRTDARILEEVSDRLFDDDRVDASDIEVSVTEGEVTLAGHVRSRMEKWRAESVAASVRGVRDVENRLRVKTD